MKNYIIKLSIYRINQTKRTGVLGVFVRLRNTSLPVPLYVLSSSSCVGDGPANATVGVAMSLNLPCWGVSGVE